MSLANATMPADRETAVADISNAAMLELETTRVLFFAGDAIPDNEKFEMPTVKGHGGMFMPQIKTLSSQKGMLYRCKFTALEPHYIDEWQSMLPPGERKAWQAGFIQKDGIYKDGAWRDNVVSGFTTSDPNITKDGVFGTKRSNHIVYRKRLPGSDIRKATQRSMPNGVGGVVEITALKGSTVAERRDAQLYFFENWLEIQKGHARLPETVRELEELIKARMKATPFEWPIEKQNQYRQIASEMLRSCAEFRNSAHKILKNNETVMKDASTKGHTAVYPQVAEMLLEMTESKRKDDLISGESSSVDRLARAMETDRAANTEIEKKRLELEERKLFLEEVKLGIRKVEDEPQIVQEAEVSVATSDEAFTPVEEASGPSAEVEPILCGKPKADGELCTRSLKEGEWACFQHN